MVSRVGTIFSQSRGMMLRGDSNADLGQGEVYIMSLYEIGRVCVKTVGREAGSHCVIVEVKDEGYVVVTGPKHLTGVRRRSCNTGRSD